VHLVGFIIRIYHNPLSPERQIRNESDYVVMNCSNKLRFKLKNAV